MESPPTTPVTQALQTAGVPYRFFRHSGPVHSLEQAARERGQRPEQIIRSLLFRLSGDVFVMVLIAGERQVSWPALRHHLDTSRITMATPAEVLAVTGYVTGAVSPFGLPTPLRILVDESALLEEEISIGSGERGSTVILLREHLLAALGPCEIGRFAAG